MAEVAEMAEKYSVSLIRSSVFLILNKFCGIFFRFIFPV